MRRGSRRALGAQGLALRIAATLKRKVIDRLKPYINRFGYGAAVEASPAGDAGEVAGARARAVLGLPKRRVGRQSAHAASGAVFFRYSMAWTSTATASITSMTGST